MGIFSDIAEEMAEDAYAEGFWDGVFWPWTVVKKGSLFLIDRAYLAYWRWQDRNKPKPRVEPILLPRVPIHGMSYKELWILENPEKEHHEKA